MTEQVKGEEKEEFDWGKWIDFVSWLHFLNVELKVFNFKRALARWWIHDKQASPQDTRTVYRFLHLLGKTVFRKTKREGEKKKKAHGSGWELVVFVSRSVGENSQNPVYKSKSLHMGFFFSEGFSLGWLLTTFSTSSEWKFCASSVLHVLLWRGMAGFPGLFPAGVLPALLLVSVWGSQVVFSLIPFICWFAFSVALLI